MEMPKAWKDICRRKIPNGTSTKGSCGVGWQGHRTEPPGPLQLRSHTWPRSDRTYCLPTWVSTLLWSTVPCHFSILSPPLEWSCLLCHCTLKSVISFVILQCHWMWQNIWQMHLKEGLALAQTGDRPSWQGKHGGHLWWIATWQLSPVGSHLLSAGRKLRWALVLSLIPFYPVLALNLWDGPPTFQGWFFLLKLTSENTLTGTSKPLFLSNSKSNWQWRLIITKGSTYN